MFIIYDRVSRHYDTLDYPHFKIVSLLKTDEHSKGGSNYTNNNGTINPIM